MDIEKFYEQDERRRKSAEIELGVDWHDQYGVRYELSWVEDTGELYVMREPAPAIWEDPFGGVHVPGTHAADDPLIQGLVINVVGQVKTHADLERVLEGWEGEMGGKDSIHWLVTRLKSTGILTPDHPGSADPAGQN